MTDARENLVLLLKPESTDVLLVRQSSGGWGLPAIRLASRHKWWREARDVITAVRLQFGPDIVMLRCSSVIRRRAGCRTAVFLVEPRSEWSPPNDAQWVSIDEATARCEDEDVKSALASYAGGTLSTLPWNERGWLNEAASWIAIQADLLGMPIVGPVEQIRVATHSSVLRVMSRALPLYMKACSPMYAHEPALTRVLALRSPTVLPRVWAIDPARRWILMEGVDGVRLNLQGDRTHYANRLEGLAMELARLQRDWSLTPDELRSAGCPDRGLSWLGEKATVFLTEVAPALIPGLKVSPRTVRVVQEAIEALRSFAIPDSIDHWDYHSANFVTTDSRAIVIDWNGAISHPFFSIEATLQEASMIGAESRVIDAYLTEWQHLASPIELRAALGLSQRIVGLHWAIGHHYQYQNMQSDWEREIELRSMGDALRSLVAQNE